jgi:VWFA-related protein
MSTVARFGMLLPFLFCSLAGFAQQSAPAVKPAAPGPQRIYLDVVVTPKSGAPVAGLGQQDFTLSDNEAPQAITLFRALGGATAPVEVIVVVDALNAPEEAVAIERGEIDKFLRANGGKLAHPTTLAIITDKGPQIQSGFSMDGNVLSKALDHYTIGLRDIQRSQGFYGASERVQISIQALHMLAAHEATLPGRKIVLWVSPGWALLTGPHVDLGSKKEQEVFNTIVSLSTELRKARMTLYSIDPLGTNDAGGTHIFYYQNFLKGIRKPSQVDIADIALQVLATQTGGLALNSSNDIAALLRECVADTDAYYELSFNPAPGEPDEYHQIEVKVAKPGLTARTRMGYYSLP